MHIESIGKGYPLVLLHGWGWHSDIWKPLLPLLTEKFEVFLIDLPGFGKSPSSPNHSYTIENITELLIEATPAHAAWLGWSLGGMLAWYIAIHFPAHISHLITVASSPRFLQGDNWPGVQEATLKKFQLALVHDYQQTLEDFLALQLRGDRKNSLLINGLKKQIARNTAPTPLSALSGGLSLLQQIDLRNDLMKVQCPSLHLFGHHDVLVPIRIISLIQPYLLFGKCEIIKRTGHIPFLSQTEIFLEHVFSWFSTN